MRIPSLIVVLLVLTGCPDTSVQANRCACLEAGTRVPTGGVCHLTLDLPPGANACAVCC